MDYSRFMPMVNAFMQGHGQGPFQRPHPRLDQFLANHPGMGMPGAPNGNTGIVPPHMQQGAPSQGFAVGEFNPSLPSPMPPMPKPPMGGGGALGGFAANNPTAPRPMNPSGLPTGMPSLPPRPRY